MRQLYIDLSGLKVKIEHTEEFISTLSENYIISVEDDNEIDIYVKISFDDLIYEYNTLKSVFSKGNYEQIAAFRKLLNILPNYNRCFFHGAVITFQDKGFMFTAPSGTGKTTHISLWKEYLGKNVDIVNGDKPVLKIEETVITAYGTPWAGKECWQKNRSTALDGICIIKRGTENKIAKLSPEEAMFSFYKQMFWPEEKKEAGLVMEMMDKILRTVPIYLLECDISEEAVKTSFEAMTNLSYNEYRCQNGEDSHEN